MAANSVGYAQGITGSKNKAAPSEEANIRDILHHYVMNGKINGMKFDKWFGYMAK